MTRGKPIIVCSISQSKTSNDVIDIIQQLCPGEEVTFQLVQKRTRFDGRKVVFCHSNLDSHLALTDSSDSVYDKAITEACRIVGKANVTFIVTKVSAAKANLRRRMIKETQPTLISNIEMLLLVDRFDAVDHVDHDNINKLRDFLKEAVRPPTDPPINLPIPVDTTKEFRFLYNMFSANNFVADIMFSRRIQPDQPDRAFTDSDERVQETTVGTDQRDQRSQHQLLNPRNIHWTIFCKPKLYRSIDKA